MVVLCCGYAKVPTLYHTRKGETNHRYFYPPRRLQRSYAEVGGDVGDSLRHLLLEQSLTLGFREVCTSPFTIVCVNGMLEHSLEQ